MKFKFSYLLYATAFASMTLASCTNDLNTVPLDQNSITSATLYNDTASYKMVLAKCYAGLSVSGQQGPSGLPDITGIDEGTSTYLRQFFMAQELPTDEAVCGWNDPGVADYHNQKWASSNVLITAMYNRIFYQISLCNEYIRQITDAKLSSRNVSSTLRASILHYRAEARFLRALSYYHALDMFGSVPFVTENDNVGKSFPKQISRSDLFNYIESELKAIDADLVVAHQNEYGRADQAAAWTLLAKLYLNAEVYIKQPKYTECITYCKKILGAGYTIDPTYSHLFMADNNTASGIIFPITFDGNHSKTYGGNTYIIHAEVGGNMVPSDYGIDGGWGGNRVTSALVNKFQPSDKRAMFYSNGQSLEIKDITQFADGYAVTKWSNRTSTGGVGSNITYVDTDFPLFRIEDVYLMYAEAIARGGNGGDINEAITDINQLQHRAFGDDNHKISATDVNNLDFILDERARELFWECQRRTDLIRFGKFSNTTYTWPWKGGVAAGTSTDAKFNVFPIPSSDIGANPNLTQNAGY